MTCHVWFMSKYEYKTIYIYIYINNSNNLIKHVITLNTIEM
jgi:hypothetical protein